MSDAECNASAQYMDCHDVLLCWLENGHDGPHHDTADHVMWDWADGQVAVWPEGEAQP